MLGDEVRLRLAPRWPERARRPGSGRPRSPGRSARCHALVSALLLVTLAAGGYLYLNGLPEQLRAWTAAILKTMSTADKIALINVLVTGIGVLVTGIGLLVAVIALLWTARSVSLARDVAKYEFWLTLREFIERYHEVHVNLRPGGKWHIKDWGNKDESSKATPNKDDWPHVEAYMGLFEFCEYLIDKKIFDVKLFRSTLKYRLGNIVKNEPDYPFHASAVMVR
jgi:hypothetical protein